MAKEAISEEVQVLKFFETGPIDKVGVVYNIVCEKMRERLRAEKPEAAPVAKRRGRSSKNATAPPLDPGIA